MVEDDSPADEVRNGVTEKSAPEEVRETMQPFHCESCLSAQSEYSGDPGA
jgi:hypothetical protein